jgi:hypothetical protein
MIACPKCKSNGTSIVLTEFWRDSLVEFDQQENGALPEEGVLKEGNPYEVRGWCLDCGKRWKLRGVMQVSQLAGYRQKGPTDAR